MCAYPDRFKMEKTPVLKEQKKNKLWLNLKILIIQLKKYVKFPNFAINFVE